MSYGVQHLRNGWTHDIECARSSHRLRLAFAIAEHSPSRPTWATHNGACGRHPDNLIKIADSYRGQVCCNCGCEQNPIAWPKWVDDDVLQAIWNLACQIQDKRGAYNRNHAEESRARSWARHAKQADAEEETT